VKVVTFYKWVPSYLYDFAPVQDCKIFSYIKKKIEMIVAGGFFPH